MFKLKQYFTGGFVFAQPGELRDDDLRLVLRETLPAAGGRVPTYRFRMEHGPDGSEVGSVDLRVGHTHDVVTYAGHIGYGVNQSFRGQRFAARSVRLLFPLARHHSIFEMWITCDPDNVPSRRTCEILGGELISTVSVPKNHPYYAMGSRAKCRYRLQI